MLRNLRPPRDRFPLSLDERYSGGDRGGSARDRPGFTRSPDPECQAGRETMHGTVVVGTVDEEGAVVGPRAEPVGQPIGEAASDVRREVSSPVPLLETSSHQVLTRNRFGRERADPAGHARKTQGAADPRERDPQRKIRLR